MRRSALRVVYLYPSAVVRGPHFEGLVVRCGSCGTVRRRWRHLHVRKLGAHEGRRVFCGGELRKAETLGCTFEKSNGELRQCNVRQEIRGNGQVPDDLSRMIVTVSTLCPLEVMKAWSWMWEALPSQSLGNA